MKFDSIVIVSVRTDSSRCDYLANNIRVSIFTACLSQMNMSKVDTMKGECTTALLNIQCATPNDVTIYILLLICT